MPSLFCSKDFDNKKDTHDTEEWPKLHDYSRPGKEPSLKEHKSCNLYHPPCPEGRFDGHPIECIGHMRMAVVTTDVVHPSSVDLICLFCKNIVAVVFLI